MNDLDVAQMRDTSLLFVRTTVLYSLFWSGLLYCQYLYIYSIVYDAMTSNRCAIFIDGSYLEKTLENELTNRG